MGCLFHSLWCPLFHIPFHFIFSLFVIYYSLLRCEGLHTHYNSKRFGVLVLWQLLSNISPFGVTFVNDPFLPWPCGTQTRLKLLYTLLIWNTTDTFSLVTTVPLLLSDCYYFYDYDYYRFSQRLFWLQNNFLFFTQHKAILYTTTVLTALLHSSLELNHELE